MYLKYNYNGLEATSLAFCKMYELQIFADVNIIVKGQQFAAHRVVLATRSEYFRELLLNSDYVPDESGKTVICLRVPLQPFKLLLAYHYTGKLEHQAETSVGYLLELLRLARLFKLSDVVEHLGSFLAAHLTIDNVVEILKCALECDATQSLAEASLKFVDHSSMILQWHPSFNSMTTEIFVALLDRHSLLVPEKDLFSRAVAWHRANPNADLTPILHSIRFALFDLKFLVKTVYVSGIIKLPLLFSILEAQFAKSVRPRSQPFLFELEDPTTTNAIYFDAFDVFDYHSFAFVLHSSLDGKNWSYIENYCPTHIFKSLEARFPQLEARYIKISVTSGENFNITNFMAHILEAEERDFGDPKNGAVMELKYATTRWRLKFSDIHETKVSRKCVLRRITVCARIDCGYEKFAMIQINTSSDGVEWQMLFYRKLYPNRTLELQTDGVIARYIQIKSNRPISVSSHIKCFGNAILSSVDGKLLQ